MASALTKEMEMMEAQLNQYKEAACEVVALRGEADSLRGALDSKVLTSTCFHFLIVGEQKPDSRIIHIKHNMLDHTQDEEHQRYFGSSS